jgi:moderate conductance mechanosensitive channel
VRILELEFLSSAWRSAAYGLAALALAMLFSRASTRLAEAAVARYERRHDDPRGRSTAIILGLRRRETIVSLVRSSVRYAAYGLAALFILVRLGGTGGTGALAGASLVVVLIGFALQRFLIDILSGFFMQFEGWYEIGDSVVVEPWDISGVVEEVSLRMTKLRALNGELQYVHNSQVLAVRVLPRGLRELSVELFVRDGEAGRRLFEQSAEIMPVGPTEFVRRPWIERIDHLDGGLCHLRGRATLAPEREWLANGFFVSVLRERATDGLIVHGPVILEYDESARRRFARSTGPFAGPVETPAG